LLSKDLGVHQDSNSHSGSSFGSVRVHSLTLSYTLGNMRCDSWVSFLARTFASPCLGRKPKARVATNQCGNMQNEEGIYHSGSHKGNTTESKPTKDIFICMPHLWFEWT